MSTSEEHTSELQARIRHLEAERARTSAETERLRAENHELRHLLEIKGPDIVRTLDARDAAMQKLHRAQRFIQDLLDERRGIDRAKEQRRFTLNNRHHRRRRGKTALLAQDSALEGWYIEYSRPPATAVLTTTTSLTYAELQERLRLDDETTPGMRVQIHGDLMFLCQPIVLEGPDSTYLVDWGEEAVNEGTVKYLTQNECRPVNTVFHAFVNPKAQDAWWYLGAHKLSPADTPSVWHKIMWQKGEASWPLELRRPSSPDHYTQERKELASVLSARWKAPLGIKDIARRIRTHELKQCCLELRSDGLRAESVTFTERVLKMKYRVLDEEEAG
ncbi:predicted protein [Postia placenta Mad-698-R]|nr:predicted protein [Postia placenta Mad-698-R]